MACVDSVRIEPPRDARVQPGFLRYLNLGVEATPLKSRSSAICHVLSPLRVRTLIFLLPISSSLLAIQELEQKAERCVVQLSNAEKLIGGLGGEEKRWKDTVATLTLAMDKLPGGYPVFCIGHFPGLRSDQRIAGHTHAQEQSDAISNIRE